MVEIPKRGGWGVRHLGKIPKKFRIFFLRPSLSSYSVLKTLFISTFRLCGTIASTDPHYQTRQIHPQGGFTKCARKMQTFKHSSIFFDVARVRSRQCTFSISIRLNIGFLGGGLGAFLCLLFCVPSFFLLNFFFNFLFNFSHNRGLVPPLPICQCSAGK